MQPSLPLCILIAAGHSNIDSGAIANGFTEASLTVALRNALANSLIQRGAKVITDGVAARNLPLSDSANLARNNPDGINLEFHFNAASLGVAGVEVLANPRHRRLAQKLAAAISSATGTPLRGDRGYRPENAGRHHRLAFVQAGGLIVEVCFITSVQDLNAYRRSFDLVVANLTDLLCEEAGIEAFDWQVEANTLKASMEVTTWLPDTAEAFASDEALPLPLESLHVSTGPILTFTSALIGSSWKSSAAGMLGALMTFLSQPSIKSAAIDRKSVV